MLLLLRFRSLKGSASLAAKVDLGGQGGTPTFVLKQDGENLTGTYSGALGDAPIAGTIKNSKISFDFDVQGNKIPKGR